MKNSSDITKVGILKDTACGFENYFLLVVRTRTQGTLKFSVSYNEFINGWFEERSKSDGQPMGPNNSIHRLHQGAAERLNLGGYGTEALLNYEITPTLLTRMCGKVRKNVIRWVKPRGKKGGRRMPKWMRSKAKTSGPRNGPEYAPFPQGSPQSPNS